MPGIIEVKFRDIEIKIPANRESAETARKMLDIIDASLCEDGEKTNILIQQVDIKPEKLLPVPESTTGEQKS